MSVVTAEILATVTTHVILLMFNIRATRLSAAAFLWRFFCLRVCADLSRIIRRQSVVDDCETGDLQQHVSTAEF